MTTLLFPVELPVLMNAANISFDKGASFLSTDGQIWIGSSTGSPAPATISVSNGITITNGANSIGLSFSPASSQDPVTVVTSGMSPYTVLATDYILLCNTVGGAVTLYFPNAPANGLSWIVKDAGDASVNNVTITTPSGVPKFDAATFLTINANYGHFEFFTDGSNYFTF